MKLGLQEQKAREASESMGHQKSCQTDEQTRHKLKTTTAAVQHSLEDGINDCVGAIDGILLGSSDGLVDGSCDGSTEGKSEAFLVGTMDGLSDG